MDKRLRVNERIRAREVRVIDPDGQQLGILPLQQAREEAQNRGLDLIEVAPTAKPPVCRIMDYGKFRYQQRKAQRESSKRARMIEVKSLRVRPATDDHDLNVRIRNARRFLEKGKKVRFNVLFRGPEMRHTEIGRELLKQIADAVAEVGDVEQHPRQEGRQMHMLLTPNEAVLKELARQAAEGKQKDDHEHSKRAEKEDQEHHAEDEDQEGRGEADQGDGERPDSPGTPDAQ